MRKYRHYRKRNLEPKMVVENLVSETEGSFECIEGTYDMAYKNVPVEQRQMAKGENHLRPHLIQFNRCKNVLLDGFKIRESPFWTIHVYVRKRNRPQS